MSRPNHLEAQRRRDQFAEFVARDMRAGGLDLAAANVVVNAKACKLDPWRALKLTYEPGFVAQVEKLVGFRGSS